MELKIAGEKLSAKCSRAHARSKPRKARRPRWGYGARVEGAPRWVPRLVRRPKLRPLDLLQQQRDGAVEDLRAIRRGSAPSLPRRRPPPPPSSTGWA